MDVFEDVDIGIKTRIINLWGSMTESEKTHFINQVSLVLSVWGSDEQGKKLVVLAIENLVIDGSLTLSDFGLYVDTIIENKDNIPADRLPRIKRASIIMEGYRIKNSLPSEPRKDSGI